MKIFFGLISLLIAFFFLLNVILLVTFWEIFLNLNTNDKYKVFLIIAIVESAIVISMLKKMFHDPIIDLEYNIKSFLVWWLKNRKIKFKKTPNPHINYILLFFSKTLNTLKNIKSEFIHGKKIKWEVEIGTEIQWKMLTKKLINIPSLDIVAKSKPAWEIWWDSYDIINRWDNYYIYVWDATWHWVWAGFIMMMANSLISWFSKFFKSWAQILSNTNEILKPRIKSTLLMSMILVRWNEKEKRLFMTWAWHEYLIIYKHKKNKCYKIKSGWVALGMVKDMSKIIKEQEIKFEENDIIVLYSDGITESINLPKKDGTEEIFWEDRLIEAIEKAPEQTNKDYKTARSVFNNITIELSKFMWYKYTQLDDITLTAIHYMWEDHNIVWEDEEEILDDFITEWNWE